MCFRQVSFKMSVLATDFFNDFAENRILISLSNYRSKGRQEVSLESAPPRVHPLQEFLIWWRSCYLFVQVETNADVCKTTPQWPLYRNLETQKPTDLTFCWALPSWVLEALLLQQFCMRISISKQHQTSW